MDEPAQGGRLVVVATPIGNLEDITARARRELADADLVACEDTRRTGRLLAHLGITTKLVSLHEHNERRRLPGLLQDLAMGRTIAVVSDAGTPLLSDPGYLLVREAANAGIDVVPIPGPSAVTAALVGSALPPYPFTFAGFPPPKRQKRRTFFGRFLAIDHTLVFFESPHRLIASLEDALEVFGDRPAAIARELTKLHEEFVRGSLQELLQRMAARPSLKGEFVLVVGRAVEPAARGDSES